MITDQPTMRQRTNAALKYTGKMQVIGHRREQLGYKTDNQKGGREKHSDS